MTDETQFTEAPPANQSPGANGSPARPVDTDFPVEPFACPDCGQMLGPGVRVCVACHRPIDPERIKAVIATASPQPGFVPRVQPQVRFPWLIFLIFLVMGSVMMREGAAALGPLKAMLVIGAIQVISSIWVFYDAHQRGIKKPFYWGIGSLFLWLPFFSWYLVRRRQPRAACSLIESSPGQFLRTLALIFFATMFLTLLLALLGTGGTQPAKAPPTTTSDHGGSVAFNWR